MSILLYDDDDNDVDDAVDSRDDLVWCVDVLSSVCFDDCDDLMDLFVLREGERTGEGAVLCVEDADDDGRLLVDADSDAEVLIEEE